MASYTQPLSEHNFALMQQMQVCLKTKTGHLPFPGTLIALLDTGCTQTLVGQGIIDQFQLASKQKSNIYGIGGEKEVTIYQGIEIVFPFHLPFNGGKFSLPIGCTGEYFSINYPFNIIIGMDILTQGTFKIDGAKKQYSLIFPKNTLIPNK